MSHQAKTYRIGEAAKLLDLKTHVLRFWESEFPQIKPLRTDKGQRLYTEDNLETLKAIKRMLHDEGMTIDGARKKLSRDDHPFGDDLVEDIIDELKAIKQLLHSADCPIHLPSQEDDT